MSITTAANTEFVADCEGFPTGLTGTLGVSIIDADDSTVVVARTTEGITESPADSGAYTATLTAPAASGSYRVYWDTGTVGPATTALEDLTVTATLTGSFATADDLAARLGLTFTADEQTRATMLLDQASSLIQDETKQTISQVTDDVLTMRSSYSERIRLPQRPVVSISSVTLTPQGGTPTVIDDSTYYLDGDELVRASFPVRYQQFFADWTRGWLGPLYTISITYTHGWEDADIPATVKAVCVEMVSRVWTNPGAVQQESIAGVLTSYSLTAQPTGLLMSDAEKAAVNAVVKRNSGSITLR